MGEGSVKKDRVMRSELHHDRHTVSLLTDHLVFSPNLSLEKKALPKKHGFQHLKEWCPGTCGHRKKPRFKKSEMHGDLPSNFKKFDQNAASQQGTVVSASERQGGARYMYPKI
jgi:hypothetical protein